VRLERRELVVMLVEHSQTGYDLVR